MARELAVASGSLSFTALKALTPELAVEVAAHKSTLELAGVKLPRPAKIQATRRLKSVFVGKNETK